jgi:NADH:ubiquinone oxidoreductase subunit 5 (subunit L)/multisubunit Na+/H+ antiporter MnhA subunit
LLALGAANGAFLADHFLGRYVALETVALCVALAPLIEMRGPSGTRLAWRGYLLLRTGDAGLLVAILILQTAAGTLSIGPALEAGGTLGPARLGWVLAGFVLAVWVKMGGWPLHLWGQIGRKLSPTLGVWLYAVAVPNLGAYLLYRVAPLLAVGGPPQVAALWLGSAGAVLAASVALAHTDARSALVFVGAAQAGLALFVAAAGAGLAVWLGILALTPVRLLIFLTVGASQPSSRIVWRRARTSLIAVGGLAQTAFGVLTAWWARSAGAPLSALLVAEAAVALTGVWMVRTAWRLSGQRQSLMPRKADGGTVRISGVSSGGSTPWRLRASPRGIAHWMQWATLGLLGSVVLAGGPAFGPLVRGLAGVAHHDALTLPAFPALLRHAATSPALLGVLALGLALWWLQRRSGVGSLVTAETTAETYDLGEGLSRAARALRAGVEVGIAERLVALAVLGVVNGARAVWTVEHRGLDGLTSRTARAVVKGASAAYRGVEQGGLEGMLRRGAGAVLALSRILKRWHSGRLRRNLLWLPVALVVAVLALVVWGG